MNEWALELVRSHAAGIFVVAAFSVMVVGLGWFLYTIRVPSKTVAIPGTFCCTAIIFSLAHIFGSSQYVIPFFVLDVFTIITSLATIFWAVAMYPQMRNDWINKEQFRSSMLAIAKTKFNNRFKAFIEASGNTIWSTDVNDHLTPESRISWAAVTGMTDEELSDGGWRNAIHPDYRELSVSRFNEFSKLGLPYSLEYPIKLRNGEYRVFAIRVVPVADDKGEHVEWIRWGIDVQDRVDQQNALLKAKQEAEAANQAKTDFLAVMSHELRTPLTAVTAFGELLEDSVLGELAPQQIDAVQRIRRAGNHLISMIDQILHFSAIEEGRITIHPEVMNISKLVDEVYHMMRPLCVERGIDFSYECCPKTIMGSSDTQKLRQIVINLVSNAIKFTDEGCIRLVCQKRDKQFIEIRVEDTGIGIRLENQQKIFEKFWQVQQGLTRRAGGAGLGLAITKKFVDILGGKIIVTSTIAPETHGSIFTVVLPLNLPDSIQ